MAHGYWDDSPTRQERHPAMARHFPRFDVDQRIATLSRQLAGAGRRSAACDAATGRLPGQRILALAKKSRAIRGTWRRSLAALTTAGGVIKRSRSRPGFLNITVTDRAITERWRPGAETGPCGLRAAPGTTVIATRTERAKEMHVAISSPESGRHVNPDSPNGPHPHFATATQFGNAHPLASSSHINYLHT